MLETDIMFSSRVNTCKTQVRNRYYVLVELRHVKSGKKQKHSFDCFSQKQYVENEGCFFKLKMGSNLILCFIAQHFKDEQQSGI